MFLKLFIFAVLLSGHPMPQDEAAKPDETHIRHCLICHGSPHITAMSDYARRTLLKIDPGDFVKPLKSDEQKFRAKLYVDPARYLGSAHAKLQCVECHTGVPVGGHAPAPGQVDWKATCASCHEKRAASYEKSYHGVFRRLGHTDTAVCSSCHVRHATLKADDPASHIHPDNISSTCAKCHEKAGPNLAGFRAHQDPESEDEPLILRYLDRFTSLLFAVVIGFFGLHSLLFFFRSIPDLALRARMRRGSDDAGTGKSAVLRFSRFHRIVHLLIIVSFFGLCVTGLPMSFSGHGIAKKTVELMGGIGSCRLIHRWCAAITLIYALLHLVFLLRCRGFLLRGWFARKKRARADRVSGEGSLLFGPADLNDLKEQCKWFLFAGPRPRFKRFSYMEKFDYFAVFFGVLVMGSSGLILWFPMFFTGFLPGWVINAAKLVHSKEAILAVCYVFAIHFFNVHLRPLNLPMSLAMFDGTLPASHISLERDERSHEPANKGDGPLEGNEKTAPLTKAVFYLFGSALLVFGLLILGAVIAGLIKGA